MSDNYSLIIKNGSCFINGKLEKIDIALSGNKIKKIGKIELNSSKVFDATDKLVLPGIIDTQVHFREPGSIDREDLESGSRAAVLGGITSVFEMPNTNPPTSNLIEFDKKLNLAKDRMHCNYAFYFGATPENVDQLSKLKNLKGCCGVKLFAGSSTGKLLVAKEEDIEKVISNSDRVVSIHSEDEEILNLRKKFIKDGDVHSHPEWRNNECAMSSTRRVVKIAERYNKQIHVLHVTTKEEVDFLAMHKKNVTFEITPQHLTLYAPDCYDKLGSFAQMNPPIRKKEHNDVFIFSLYEKDQTSLGFRFCDHLMATPENLSFFFDHVIKTTMTEGHAGKLGSSQYNALIRPHLAETVCPDVLKKFDKTVKVGCQYNDPKVSWKKLLMSGAVLVDKQRPQEHLKEYLINLVDKT